MKDSDWCVWAPSCGPFPKTENAKPLLFWDAFIPGNFYYATTDRIKDAMYHINRNFALRGMVLYSEFLEFIKVEPTEESTKYGWSAYEMTQGGLAPWIDFCITKKDDEDWYRIEYAYGPTSIYEWEEEL